MLSVYADVEFGHEVNDTLMRFFNHCTRYVQEVDQNQSAVTEVQKFKQGLEMMRVQEKIAQHLGVSSSLLTYGCIHVLTLYMQSCHLLFL